ncbi:chemotaxis protein CheW [Roseateles sp.]|uniref:chemotaxis protein CheW n=1 Tax=Roseateles sp. TaxID=1971397 RepID=UPI0032655D5C
MFLLVQLGKDRYALDIGQVTAVLPRLDMKAVPRAPPAVAGLCNYRGAPVPVIDLSELTLGRPASSRLSTRIVLVHFPDPAGGPQLLGLLAEQATQTLRREPADFVPAGVDPDGASYLGPVTSDARGLIQRIDVLRLLPAPVRELLFNEPKQAS